MRPIYNRTETFATVLATAIIAIVIAVASLLAGCGRALPVEDLVIDAGTTADLVTFDTNTKVDLATAPDLMCADDDSSPFCYPIRHDLGVCESASTCGCVDGLHAIVCYDKPGEGGCGAGFCRGR